MLTLLKNDADFAQFAPSKFLGSGSSGCVLLGTLNGKECVFKCLLLNVDVNAIKREIFIGKQLKDRLPADISKMFIGTTQAYISERGIPASWTTFMNDECKGKFTSTKPQKVVVLIQPYITGIVPGHDWLVSRTKANAPVSPECIRSIIFQLVIGLSYAQSTIGFQHNDLKLENIMFLPVVKQTKTLVYQMEDGDVFTIVLNDGDVEVRFIDFGGSSLRLNDEIPEFLRTSYSHTPGYIPFELSLASDTVMASLNSPLFDRHYDADSMGIFGIFMNLLCNLRAPIPDTRANSSVWLYNYGDLTDAKGNIIGEDPVAGIDVFMPYNDSVSGYPPTGKKKALDYSHLAPLYDLFATTSNLNIGKTIDKAQMATILNMLALFHALNIFPDTTFDISYRIPNDALSKVYEIIVTDEFKTLFEKLVESGTSPTKATDLWMFINELAPSVFGEREAFSPSISFITWLCAPTAQLRAAFGVNDALSSEYLLSNALYHPFLAYPYWKTNKATTGLPETGAPFKFNVGANSAPLIADAKKFIVDFDDLFKQPAAVVARPPVSKAKIPSKVVLANMELLEKDIIVLYAFAEDDTFLMKVCPTADAFTKGIFKSVMAHSLQFSFKGENKSIVQLRDNVTIVLDGYNYIQDEDATPLSPTDKQYASETNRRRICMILLNVAIGNYLLFMHPLDETEAEVASEYFVRAIGWSTPVVAGSKNDNGSSTFTDPWELEFYGDPPMAFEEATETERAFVEEEFGDISDLVEDVKTSYKPRAKAKDALPDMISNLENIERLFEFKPDDIYDLPTIQTQLYAPIREHALEVGAPLESVIKHLGLESETMFESPKFVSLDMTNEANQTRYFHTLSIVATMIHTNDYTEMERCFVEWPPKAALRPGEAHEI